MTTATMNRKSIAEKQLNARIESGRQKSQALIHTLSDEADRRHDYLVSSRGITFDTLPPIDTANNTRLTATFRTNGHTTQFQVHDNAKTQLLNKLGVPQKFFDVLAEEKPSIAKELLNDLRYRQDANSLFIRTVANNIGAGQHELLAVMSHRYKPVDFTEVGPKFLEAIQANGMILTDAMLGENLKYSFRAIYPQLLGADDPYLFGVSFSSSDYGLAALNLQLFIERLVCVNGMVGTRLLRQVHSGESLSGGNDDIVQVSEETLRKSAEVTISYMGDAMNSVTPERVEQILSNARDKTVNVNREIDSLRKSGVITKAQGEDLQGIMDFGGTEILPQAGPKNSIERFANALSYLAHDKSVSVANKMRLQEAAGNALMN